MYQKKTPKNKPASGTVKTTLTVSAAKSKALPLVPSAAKTLAPTQAPAIIARAHPHLAANQGRPRLSSTVLSTGFGRACPSIAGSALAVMSSVGVGRGAPWSSPVGTNASDSGRGSPDGIVPCSPGG